MTRIAFFALLLTACSSPYERGLDLGREHAELLKEGELTFNKLTRDLNEADEKISEATEVKEFRRGYSEAIEPVKKELDKLVLKELASDAIDQLGATATALVDSIKDTIKTPDGKIDREKLRALGRDFGEFMRDLKESAEEFGKGAKEGFEEGR